MTAFECYQEYVSLKTHFTTFSYDYFQRNGKTTANWDSYEKRKDKLFFEKLRKFKDVQGFLVANLLDNDSFYVGDCVLNERTRDIYIDWKKRTESLSYRLRQDLNKLDDDFDTNFRVNDGHPYILRLFLQGEICLETLVILFTMVNILPSWNKQLDDPIWKMMRRKILKYKPFLKYDQGKIAALILNRYK
jgi:hypothetical protein